MENRIKEVLYQGKTIIYGDYAGVTGEEFAQAIEQQEALSLKSSSKKILHLLNFTDCRMNDDAKKRANAMVENLTKAGFETKTACFGITGIQRIIAGAVKRDMYFAKSEEDAKQWLVSQ